MVTIVGRDQKAVLRVTCKSCAAILEYTKCEVLEYSGTDIGGGSDGYAWIDCPDCNCQVVLRSW